MVTEEQKGDVLTEMARSEQGRIMTRCVGPSRADMTVWVIPEELQTTGTARPQFAGER